jgi:two-component system, chemotaxis family, protein-glutamate methylesterase/glutaminase
MMDLDLDLVDADMEAIERDQRPGVPSVFTCPECHGTLWEVQDHHLMRFRCRVGHAYSPESLYAEQSEELEAALWIALRTLEEKVSLTSRLGDQARERGHYRAEKLFLERVRDTEEAAGRIRDVLMKTQLGTGDGAPGPIEAVDERVRSPANEAFS